ncbi:hypothetical protein [Horticoccus sp. 23ND18S-11]|uniref:hypothetical protein n=1 Tax=Horticoccus sp. 23ND18S-11 TaxID=3391832 RepID=UPI0039C9F8F1
MKSKIHASLLGLVALGAALVSPLANALTINVDGPNLNTDFPLAAYGTNPAALQNRWETDVGGPGNYSSADIKLVTGFGGTLTEYFKVGNDGSQSGPLASSYSGSSIFNNQEDFTISYGSGAFVTGSPIFLYVKDGNNSPIHYIFEIVWNGKETINGLNFWAADLNGGTDNGAISHVSIFGTSTGTSTNTPGVPDGGMTVALLGMGLAALGLVRRFTR